MKRTPRRSRPPREPPRPGTKARIPQRTRRRRTRKTAAKTATKAWTGKKDEEDDDDEEFPGKVKRVDPTKRSPVITLLNGKDRSYLLSKDVKILVKGTASKQGLQDPMSSQAFPSRSSPRQADEK